MASDLTLKFAFPAGFTAEVSDFEDFEDQNSYEDYNGDGMPEYIIQSNDGSTFVALDPNDSYAEVWTFTGNPEDIALNTHYFYFRFKGFHTMEAGTRHAMIGFEYYDPSDVQHFGLLFYNVASNRLDWRIDDYGYQRRIVLNTGLEDLVLRNRINGSLEIWGIGDASAAVHALAPTLRLDQNHPNPFNPVTTISFAIDTRMNADLEIHDVKGRLVHSRNLGVLNPGEHQYAWEGREDNGRQVASGVYFCTISAGDKQQSRKMTLVR